MMIHAMMTEKNGGEIFLRLHTYWSIDPDQLLTDLNSAHIGLNQANAERRLKQYGPNSINAISKTIAIGLLLSQFKSPLVLAVNMLRAKPALTHCCLPSRLQRVCRASRQSIVPQRRTSNIINVIDVCGPVLPA